MKICRKLLPLTALALCAITATVGVLTIPVLAQQQDDPVLKATESLLLEQTTQHRNWRAQAETYLRQFNGDEAKLADQQKQLDGAHKQIADLQQQIAKAKEDTAATKALPPAHSSEVK